MKLLMPFLFACAIAAPVAVAAQTADEKAVQATVEDFLTRLGDGKYETLDADLTAQIYLELVGGRQRGLALAPAEIVETKVTLVETVRVRPTKLTPLLTQEELALHAAFIAKELGENSVWTRIASRL